MAVFPQGKTRIRERANTGERKVLDALARHLEDDYTVWHNIPIMGSGHEPDFVILHPERGLLIIEVKHWRARTLVDANPLCVQLQTDRGLVTEIHPVSQARGYAQDIVHVLQKHPELLQQSGAHKGKLIMPWGWGAVLSNIKAAEVAQDPGFVAVFEPHKVMLADDLADDADSMAFQQKLWSMFSVNWACKLKLPQLGIIRGVLFPELRIGLQQELPLDHGAPALVVRDVLQVMDLQQEAVARGLGEGHRVIHGPAGSGKTMILIYRAVQLQAVATPDKPVLVLCFNRDLKERIESMLRLKGVGPQVQVRTFHSWALELVRTYQLARAGQRLRHEDYDALARVACEGITASRIPSGQYTSILIDEAHDLADDWLAAAATMVDPATKSLLVLYDDAQSIYQKDRRKLSFARLGIEARGRTEILRINYRNTAQVLALAMECARTLLKEKQASDGDEVPLIVPDSAGRPGPMPTLRCFDSGAKEREFVVAAIAEELANGRKASDVAVLARQKSPLKSLASALEERGIPVGLRERGGDSGTSVKLTTLHSSKGLEYPLVYIVGLDLLGWRAEQLADEMRLLYVGMTRATHVLHLTSAGETPLVKDVRSALERVALANMPG